LDKLGRLDSILDIGCLDTPVVTWGKFGSRFSLDPLPREELPGVNAIRGKWPCQEIQLPVSVITCLQVVEHLDDPTEFCRQMLRNATHAVIVSVPWGWRKGTEPRHKQDPVDGAKLEAWMGRKPDQQRICTDNLPRGVFLYDCQVK
jgi:hypothetical protein